jgi:hypothetical protein
MVAKVFSAVLSLRSHHHPFVFLGLVLSVVFATMTMTTTTTNLQLHWRQPGPFLHLFFSSSQLPILLPLLVFLFPLATFARNFAHRLVTIRQKHLPIPELEPENQG